MVELYLWMIEVNGQPKCLIDGRPLATFYEDTAMSPSIMARAKRAANGQPCKLVKFTGMEVVMVVEQTFAVLPEITTSEQLPEQTTT